MIERLAKFVILLIASWSSMTFLHEVGHIVCGWACGGTLRSADLLPWHLPYSMFEPDPRPLVTLWGGPIFGALVPLAFALVVKANWAWFIAYFCILANGAYLATAWFSDDRFLDTPKLLEHGAHPLTIVIYCILTIGFGYVGFRKECLCVFAKPIENVPTNKDSGVTD
jgi:hypothetical protein